MTHALEAKLSKLESTLGNVIVVQFELKKK